jgi:hypothetical protein
MMWYFFVSYALYDEMTPNGVIYYHIWHRMEWRDIKWWHLPHNGVIIKCHQSGVITKWHVLKHYRPDRSCSIFKRLRLMNRFFSIFYLDLFEWEKTKLDIKSDDLCYMTKLTQTSPHDTNCGVHVWPNYLWFHMSYNRTIGHPNRSYDGHVLYHYRHADVVYYQFSKPFKIRETYDALASKFAVHQIICKIKWDTI